MNKDTHAREAQLRAISIFTKRPERAQVINRGTAEVWEGLGCIYEQDGQRLSIDMPVAIGGSDTAPPPGYFGRAAVCSCLAIGIKMTAVRESLQLEKVCVGIEQDWDNRGVLAMQGASPVPSETRIAIDISTSDSDEDIRAMVARALASDPWFLALRDAQPVTSELLVNGVVA
ncbi:OsmC family protein [Aquicoccus sp. G2-2]|uniref:OsmC family protein n=1 Tax=Aquicoccus sp. G2-2 TaxID=3092120 RepID=UPI002ADF24D9|nr:OsmC family protein [Aquicoccus sp. G2-2]MEA1113666.1 OsmC family protein [Aquicoccus sp. G2-2]